MTVKKINNESNARRETPLPSPIEETAIRVMEEFKTIIINVSKAKAQTAAQLFPVLPSGSTESWLSGTDDGSRTERVNQEDAEGKPFKPKPCCATVVDDMVKDQRFLGIITRKPEPNTLSAVGSPDEWMEIEITVDSGACETVMPADMCKCISIMQSVLSHGAVYEVANGEEIPNLGSGGACS